MKKLFILCLFIISLPIVNAVCINPSENIEIKDSTVFCYGHYNIENGIKIVNDDLIVDCNNSILTGNGIGYGILLKNRQNVIIENCNISNYEVGIFMDNSSDNVMQNNYISNNKFGIVVQNSVYNDIDGNFFYNNLENKKISGIQIQRENSITDDKDATKPQPKISEGNASSRTLIFREIQTNQKENKRIIYFIIYLAVSLIVIMIFYALYYRFYHERSKIK